MKQFLFTAFVGLSALTLFSFNSGNVREISDGQLTLAPNAAVSDTLPRDTTRRKKDTPAIQLPIVMQQK